jgi:ketosteroid isomerase-like protein
MAALASEGRDIDRILSYWTDDAVVLAPRFAPVIGKAALRDYVENSFRILGFKISWKSSEVRFSPDLKLAYMFGENTVTMNGPDSTPLTTTGRAITIWRREPDGQWRAPSTFGTKDRDRDQHRSDACRAAPRITGAIVL